MFGKIRKTAVCFLLVFCGLILISGGVRTEAAAKRTRILMVGNSLTRPSWFNYTAEYLEELCSAAGKKVTVECVAYNAEKMKTYANEDTSRGRELRKKIASQKWDYIILQEHTDYAMGRYSTYLKSIKTLNSYIKKTCPKATVLLPATWAYDYTTTISGKRYSTKEQQRLLNQNVEKAAKAIGAQVIHSGNAIVEYNGKSGSPDMYLSDGNHPTHAGSYVNACCIYSVIFKTSPYKNTFTGEWTQKRANSMQKTAWSYNH